jgi:protease-3
LAQEAGRYSGDWANERYEFNSQEQLADALRSLTLADVQRFYQNMILDGEGTRVLIQMRGSKFAEEEFGVLAGATIIEDFSAWSAAQAAN